MLGKKSTKNQPANILDKEGEENDIVESLGLGWLFLILKKFIAFRFYMWFLVLCIIPILTIFNCILNMSR